MTLSQLACALAIGERVVIERRSDVEVRVVVDDNEHSLQTWISDVDLQAQGDHVHEVIESSRSTLRANATKPDRGAA